MALLAFTREAVEIAVKKYMDVAIAFGLSVSLQKTKFMAVGFGMKCWRATSHHHWCWAMIR